MYMIISNGYILAKGSFEEMIERVNYYKSIKTWDESKNKLIRIEVVDTRDKPKIEREVDKNQLVLFEI